MSFTVSRSVPRNEPRLANVRIYRVPADFNNIEQAITSCVNNLSLTETAIIELAPGEYLEDINIPPNISIRGQGAMASQVTISGQIIIGKRCLCAANRNGVILHTCSPDDVPLKQCLSNLTLGQIEISKANVLLHNVVILDNNDDDNAAIEISDGVLTGNILDITGHHEKTPAVRALNSTLSFFGGGISNNAGLSIDATGSSINIEATDVIGSISIHNGTLLVMKHSSHISNQLEPLIKTDSQNDAANIFYVNFSGRGDFIKTGPGNSHRLAVGAFGNAFKFEGGSNTVGRLV